MRRAVVASLLIVLLGIAALPLSAAQNREPARKQIERVVADFTRLYTEQTLDQWQKLFHPNATAVHPGRGGAIVSRNLAQLVGEQRGGFAGGAPMSEKLENVTIYEGQRIAMVTADFVWTDPQNSQHRGKMGMHLAEGADGWKIVHLILAYDQPM